jgi:hypothetical protein
MGCGLTIEKVNCELNKLTDRVEAVEAIQASNEIANGSGTAYTLTGTAAAVNLGTDDPVVTLGAAGTYLLLATAQIEYAGATVAAETLALKLRRTNNTAADVSASPVTIDLPAATTLTHTYGVVALPPVLYTTENDDDAVTIFANLSALLGAGTVTISDANIVAVRLY